MTIDTSPKGVLPVESTEMASVSSSTTKPDIAIKSEHVNPYTLSSYEQYMRLLYSNECWNDAPRVGLTFDQLSYLVPVKSQNNTSSDKSKTVNFPVFTGFTGHIEPGRMTLILAPPGAGKSQFLNCLSGHLRDNKQITGDLLYDGLSYQEQSQAGIYPEKLCSLVAQGDVHLATYTVKEALQFAFDNSCVDLRQELFNGKLDPKLVELHQHKVDMMLSVLGMNECANTIAGNAMLRGLSGGQKKRLTIGEMMISNARVLLLDEPSTGLDAAVSRDITSVLKSWCEVSGATSVAALLAPTPEVFEMYQDLILMREGEILYHGPRTEVEQFIEQYWGLIRPEHVDMADFIVEVLTNPREQYVKQAKQIQRGKLARRYPLTANGVSTENDNMIKLELSQNTTTNVQFHFDENAADDSTNTNTNNTTKSTTSNDYSADPLPLVARDRAQWCTNNAKLFEQYKQSSFYAYQQQKVAEVQRERKVKITQLDKVKQGRSAYTLAQYGNLYTNGFWQHTKHCLTREFLLLRRDSQLAPQRIFLAIIMALIFGSLFFDLALESFFPKLGVLLYSITYFTFSGFSEMESAFATRSLVYKQIDSGMYPALGHVIAVTLTSVPLIIIETFVFTVILYFMVGFANEASRYFFFFFACFLANFFYSLVFRMLCFGMSTMHAVEQFAAPMINLCTVYSGFLILRPQIRIWQIYFYWMNPFTWAMYCLSVNEFESSKYDEIISQSDGEDGMVVGRRGDVYMESFGMLTGVEYQWAGIGYFIGVIIIGFITTARWLKNKRFRSAHGTKRINWEEIDRDTTTATATSTNNAHAIQMNGNTSKLNNSKGSLNNTNAASVLPFQPATLSFENINYWVDVKSQKDKKTVSKQLLHNVSAYVKPGSLVALMGSSGAGKTTLMDVVSGRKTAGKIEGEIRINGQLKEQHEEQYRRMCAYAEQSDCHMPLSTVRESIAFSARLRLPRTVTEEQRNAFVDEILDILELTPVADRYVGNAKYPGLSPGQLKLLTIGVELAANPSILYADEPTSGLDSRSSVVVMRVIKRIAETGRSVLCTIHQPSADVFYYFDTMLLLRSGGRTVFFGDIGEEGSKLVEYFESRPNEHGEYPRLPPGMNPASWMLDVIGAGLGHTNAANTAQQADTAAAETKEEGVALDTSSDKPKFDYADVYLKSDLHTAQMAELQTVAHPAVPVEVTVNPSDYNIDLLVQIRAVLVRAWYNAIRDTVSHIGRSSAILVCTLMFGLIYVQLDASDYPGVISKTSATFSICAAISIITGQFTLPTMIEQRDVYYKEQACRAYPSFIYSTVSGLIEIPFVFGNAIVSIAIYYFMVGFANDAELFFQFFWLIALLCLIEGSFGQLCASLFPNFFTAVQFSGFISTLFWLLAGLFIRPNNIPTGWQWFYYCNPLPKVIIPLLYGQFKCDLPNPYDINSGCQTIIDPSTNAPITVHAFIQRDWDASYDNIFARMTGWLVLTYCVYRIIIFLGLKYIVHLKR